MIQIEIISVDKTMITAAFYYPVPKELQLESAQNPARSILGSRLSVDEIANIKDGALIELVKSFPNSGQSRATIGAFLVSEWTKLRSEAAVQYKKQFDAVGTAYIDGRWQ